MTWAADNAIEQGRTLYAFTDRAWRGLGILVDLGASTVGRATRLLRRRHR
jgi:hypothetical protein